MPIPADQIDPDARKVIRRLVRSEYQAYLVGGCVRDLLLERTPKDFDIATSATPNEVKNLFRNCRIIGRRFRLAHIFFGPKIIETATFRSNPRDSEGSDLDGEGEEAQDRPERELRGNTDLLIRHDNVFGNAEEDARRRDFTINGLFYDIEADEVIDYVGGLSDLAARTVRTIGDPDIRFREDPVRILRAIKFAARLDFEIAPDAWSAIRAHSREIPKCAPPRVLEEIYRLLRGGAARRSVELMRDAGVLAMLLPEHAALLGQRADSVEAGWFFRMLDRLDTEKERAASNAVLLCVLLAPFVGEAVYEDPAGPGGRARDLNEYLDDVARPMLDAMHASRRDLERARQILLTQRRLMPSKRRRPKLASLARRDWFEEALHVGELVGLTVRPMEGAEDELLSWRRTHKGERPEEEGAFEGEGEGAGEVGGGGEDEAPVVKGRRRRRRRRGGRGGGGGGGAMGGAGVGATGGTRDPIEAALAAGTSTDDAFDEEFADGEPDGDETFVGERIGGDDQALPAGEAPAAHDDEPFPLLPPSTEAARRGPRGEAFPLVTRSRHAHGLPDREEPSGG